MTYEEEGEGETGETEEEEEREGGDEPSDSDHRSGACL